MGAGSRPFFYVCGLTRLCINAKKEHTKKHLELGGPMKKHLGRKQKEGRRREKPFRLNLYKMPEAVYVEIAGEVEEAEALEIAVELASYLSAGEKRFIFDLSKAMHLDTRFLTTLVNVSRSLQDRYARIAIICPHDHEVCQTFERTGLSMTFTLCQTRKEAHDVCLKQKKLEDFYHKHH